jgi:hypothetical protein
MEIVIHVVNLVSLIYHTSYVVCRFLNLILLLNATENQLGSWLIKCRTTH